jgi:Family of unknown function (DUF6461)
VSAYAWVDDVMAVTVTLVRGMDLRHAGDLLEVRWASERVEIFDDAQWRQVEAMSPVVQADELGDWLVLVEPNGWLTTLPDTAAALSRGGSLVSVYWNARALMRFVLARDGAVVRAFDPLLYELAPVGDPLPQEQGLVFGDPETSPRIAAMELAERLTGVRIDRDWLLDTPRRSWLVPEPVRS